MTTWKVILDTLNSDEPSYGSLVELLTPGVVRRLSRLVEEADPLLASKATYLASLASSGDIGRVIDAAARRDEPEVRVAAAAAIGSASETVESLLPMRSEGDRLTSRETLERLLKDPDAGVRKRATQASRRMHRTALTAEMPLER